MDDDKLIFINGFNQAETLRIMKAVKGVLDDPGDTAFCMGTPSNRSWTVSALIGEVRREHEYMKSHPPGGAPADSDFEPMDE